MALRAAGVDETRIFSCDRGGGFRLFRTAPREQPPSRL